MATLEVNEYPDLTLLELCNVLYKLGGIAEIKTFFYKRYYYVSFCGNNAFGIKYKDGMNFTWDKKWARDARGAWFAIINENIEYISLKLQRGAELLTKYHNVNMISETQEYKVNDKKIKKFDEFQQTIMRTFLHDNMPIPFETYVTSKVDGSLFCINLYRKGTAREKFMKTLIAENEFLMAFAEKIDNYLAVISTSGTLIIDKWMMDYFVTSYFDIPSDTSRSETEIMKENARIISSDINLFLQKNEYNRGDITLCFEGICKDRMTYKNTFHKELTVNYDSSQFIFLGATEIETQNYIPHFEWKYSPWTTPHHKPVTNTSQLFTMLTDLDSVIHNRLTQKEFAEKHGQNNIDYEGYVLLAKNPNTNKYDYSKVKTAIYYIAHNCAPHNLKYIYGLNEKAENYFPIIRKIKLYKKYANIKLYFACNYATWCIYKEMKKINNHAIYKKLPETIKKNFDQQPAKTKIKILVINDKTGTLVNLISRAIAKYFNIISQDDENYKAWIKKYYIQFLSREITEIDNFELALYLGELGAPLNPSLKVL